MHPVSLPIAMQIYSVCCVILFFKILITSVYQGVLRAKTKSYVNPEDAKLSKSESVSVENQSPEVIRVGNVVRNDVENIPMFLFLGLIYVMSNCWDRGSLIYFSVFTFSRILHTLFYIRGLQPWRSIAWSIGILMNIIISGHILYTVLLT